MNKTLPLILILISLCCNVFAAKVLSSSSYTITTDEWLDAYVICFAFSEYAAWIGTDAGFMGSTLESPNIMSVLDSQNADLPGDIITSIVVKDDESVWVGTNNGLALLDPYNYVATIPKSSPFTGWGISCMKMDNKGGLWINAMKINDNEEEEVMLKGSGLTSCNGRTWQSFTSKNSQLAENLFNDIGIGPDGTIWLGTTYNPWEKDFGSGLCSFNGASFTTHGPQEGTTSVECMAIDASGNVWMGLAGLAEGWLYGGGLARFDGQNWTYYNTENSEIPGDYVSSITIAPDGKLWMAVSETDEGYPVPAGIVSFDGIEWHLIKHKLIAGPEEEIVTICMDPEGKLWVGKSNGLVVITFL